MRYVLLLAPLLAFLAVACGGDEGAPQGKDSAEPLATPTGPPGTFRYSNPVFSVEFDYPSNWVPDPLYSSDIGGYVNAYRDPRGREFGWFNIGAVGAPTLDYVVQGSTEHKLKPFGEHPQVLSLNLPVGETRLILPDEGSAPEPFNAQLIVPYLAPIQIDAESYQYFTLDAHKDFIRAIADTLRFTGGSTRPPLSP